uniref:Transcriptional regulator ATRX n=1 Tax=Anopheles minimus TaxID=112268 RepID=A0A182VUM9_9DIPT
MSTTTDEPDLFNDVEIMEVGDFTESDENYVSVELRSDDEDDDRVILEANEYSQPKSLLPTAIEYIPVETSTYVMNSSVHGNRFLSDHQYLNEGTNRTTPTYEVSVCEQETAKVEHTGSERFSVPYVEDLGTQDLFNKDSAPDMVMLDNEISDEDIAYGEFETKIEIEAPQIQETIVDAEEIVNELIASDMPVETGEDDACYNILQSLDSASVQYEAESRSLLGNDHSYTTLHITTPQLSDLDDTASDDDTNNLRKLVTLSTNLAREGTVTTEGGKKTLEQIGKMVQTILKRSNKAHESKLKENGAEVKCSPTSNGDSPGRLSVLLSVNCSERLEDDEALPSPGGSLNGQMHEEFGSDTDCTKGAIATDTSATEVTKIVSIGTKFSDALFEWIEKRKTEESAGKTSNVPELVQLLETIKRKSEQIPLNRQHLSTSNTNSTRCKVETSVQTDSPSYARHVQRTLNEKSKQKLLDSLTNSSSDSSDSGDSIMARTSDSDRVGDKMMEEFVCRKRRLRKSAKEKRKVNTTEELGKENGTGSKKRADQIYSDSSAGEEKRSEHDEDEILLDDVLSGVDDMLSDVIGEMQDYFKNTEERQDQSKPASDEQQSFVEESSKHSGKVAGSKHVKDMTESERDNYEDMQIDRLCNFSNLVNCRNASSVVSGNAQTTTKAKDAKEHLKRKKEDSMEQFLNEENGVDTTIPLEPHSEESSESEKDVVETEEQFLKICNENIKQQLLHQASNSEETTEEDSLDDTGEDRTQNGSNDEDSSASFGSLVEHFLKRHGDSIAKSKEKQKRPQEGTSDLENSNPQLLTNVPADSPTNVAETEEVSSGKETSAEKQSADGRKQLRMELANPKDKELFSNDLFDASESETSALQPQQKPRKKRKRTNARKARLSDDTELESSSEGSDMGLASVSPKKRQRKRKALPATTETLDSTAPASTPREDDKSGAGVVTSVNDSAATAKTPTVSSTDSLKKTSSPAPGLESASSITDRSAKSKGPKDGQDCISLSSDSSDDAELISGDLDEGKTPPDKEPKRRIRPMLTNDELAEETKKAQKEEESRTARLKKKQEQLKKFMATYKPGPGESELVLDYDSVRHQPICVHPDIVKLLKPHQIEGIQFMYDNTYGSIDALPKHSGSGCILAHCMGLGKTLQIISLLHTVMRYPQLLTNRVLVICPKSTVMNWKEEIVRWQGTIQTGYLMRVYCFPDVCTQNDKISVLKRWYSCKSPNCGVMLIGYEAFRALINYERRKGSERMRSTKLELIKEYLLNPGADLVICDEGHQIKNKRSAISEAVSKIQTKRRIMLTGTPIQNNLKEYYCMVNFIKPSFLGCDKEFSNLYANPIKNGQCKDSDHQAIKIMKQRSYVLHKKLSKFVQRKEASVLKEFLPEKFEYVLFVPLTPVQEKLYEVFLQMNEYTSSDITGEPGRTKKFKLIADYTSLRKIWTHPKVLEKAWELANLEKNRKDAMRKTATPDTDDEAPDDINDIASGQLSVTNDWWRRYLQTADLESLYPSNKLWILFEILKQSNERGEKVLIFTAFVSVLNMVEHFMAKIHNQSSDPQQADEYAYSAFKGPWYRGRDYYRLDGKTPKTERHEMITSFNDPLNTFTKCFLISAKAGGQGINLTGANRVIILDTSWNPSNDQQNIFRIFRLGQKRKCYVYRLIAVGTMEEKVYSRSVTKQALSYRVVDEQQIDRHYSYGELAELYTLTKVSEMTRETPILPADDVLASLLRTFANKILKYHEHDSLLENKPEQDLSEEEKKEAWAAYEREIQNNETRSYLSQFGSLGAAAAAGGMFGSSPYGSPMPSYYSSLSYGGMPGLPISGGDMYRNDFSSYGNSMSRSLYMHYGATSQYSSMLADTNYTAALSKFFNNVSLPAIGGMDYGMPALPGHPSPLGNGQSMLPPVGPTASQGGAPGKGYGSVDALAKYITLCGNSPLAPSTLSALGQSQLPGSASSSLGDIAAQHSASSSNNPMSYFNTLKQLRDYTQSNTAHLPPSVVRPPTPSGLKISNITSLHKTNQSPSGNPNAGGVGVFNRLGEQMGITPMAAAGVSSPFSPRNVPLLSPTLNNQPKNNAGHVPISSSSTQSFTNTNTSPGTNVNATVTTPSSQSVPPPPTLAIEQGIQKNTKMATTVANAVETMRSNSSTSVLRSTSGTTVSASVATIIPSDEEDELNRSASMSQKTQNPAEKRATGTNFGITYNTTQNKSANPSSTMSAVKDVFKNNKSLGSTITQQSKSMSPSTKASNIQKPPTVPPIITNPNPTRIPLDRTKSLSALSSVSSSSIQQTLAKTVPIKPNLSSPSLNLTQLQKQASVNKPASMTRSPLTVQTVLPPSKVTLPSGSAPSPLRSGNAVQRTVGTPASATTTVSAVMAKSQLASAVASSNTTAATITRTVQKPVAGASLQNKTINALQASMGGTQTLSTRPLSNTTITQVKTAGVAIPKPKPESRPMTLTMTAIKTPLTGATAGPKMVKNPINQAISPSTIAMPKLGQLGTPPAGTSKEAAARSNAYRQLNVVQKSASTAKITPVTLLSTASMTGKLTNPAGAGATARLSTSAPGQIPAVKTSSGIMTQAPITNQPVLVARSTAAPSAMSRTPTVISRAGKSPLTINASRAGVTATKTGPTNIITTGTVQQPGSAARVSVAGALPPSTMTVIPTGNITTTAGSSRASGSVGGAATPASSLRVIPPTNAAAVSPAGLQRTSSTGGSPTTPTMTVIPTANMSGMSYSYKDVGRKDVVIHKAVASPTMRRILPSALGTQQTAIKPTSPASSSRTVLKASVPIGNIIRGGTGATNSTTTALTQGVQSAPNGVFIRKRGLDPTMLDSAKAKSVSGPIFDQQLKGNGSTSTTSADSGAPHIKRVRREHTNINPAAVTGSVLSTFGITKRICGGLLVKTKTMPPTNNNKPGDPAEVVVLE